MKKGLSLLLAASMAVSSFATAAYAADDLTAQEKFEALVEAGIFTGFEDGSAGLDQEMTRAQVAAVIVRLLGLEENAANANYTDLKDAEWAAGYIGAVTPDYMEGYGDGKFGPSDTFSYEHLATVMVRVLDIEVDEEATVDGEVSDWAEAYVAAAVNAGIITAQSDYTAPALRGALVESAYVAKDKVVPAGAVGITAAKATGVKKVEVTFNKPVDVDNANIALKKGNASVAVKTSYSEDKRTATLELTEAKISSGEYTVTLSGVEELDANKASATFTAEDEVVQNLEFVTASDTIAFADSVIVKARAVNQYGEAASTNAGSYNVFTSAAEFRKITKAEDGTLWITLDTDVPGQTQQGVSIIPVTLVNTTNFMTVTKNFKLGNAPILSKLELGEARYSIGESLAGQGENVKFDLNFFDQYGNNITWEMYDASFKQNNQVIWNSFVESGTLADVIEDNGNNIPQIKISLTKNVDKTGDYNFTVYNQAANASGVVSIKSNKIATKVQIGTIEGGLASGDEDKWVPITAYDAEGNELSADEIASDDNIARIKVTVSGADTSTGSSATTIQKTGPNKGKVKLTKVTAGNNGAVTISAVIATANATSTDTKTFTVGKVRAADYLREAKAPAKQFVPEGTNKFQFNLMDSYGTKQDKIWNSTTSGSLAGADGLGTSDGDIHYFATVTASVYGTGSGWTVEDDNNVALPLDTPVYFSNGTLNGQPVYNGASAHGDFKLFNKDFEIKTSDAVSGTLTITAELFKYEIGKVDASGNPVVTSLSKITRTASVVPNNATLNYSVKPLRELYAALDNKLVTGDHTDPALSKLAAEVSISATNAAGETVALPKVVQQITSSNQNVAQAKEDGDKGFVIGNKAGTATINVVYRKNNGETAQISLPVTVKSDAIEVKTLTAGNSEKNDVAYADLGTPDANAAVLMDLKVVDNYGAEFTKANVNNYNYLLGVTYSVSNVSGGTVQVANDGTISAVIDTADGNDKVSFDVTASAPNGLNATTTIVVTQ